MLPNLSKLNVWEFSDALKNAGYLDALAEIRSVEFVGSAVRGSSPTFRYRVDYLDGNELVSGHAFVSVRMDGLIVAEW